MRGAALVLYTAGPKLSALAGVMLYLLNTARALICISADSLLKLAASVACWLATASSVLAGQCLIYAQEISMPWFFAAHTAACKQIHVVHMLSVVIAAKGDFF